MKLLLVEDQEELASSIRNYFSKEGDVCEVADSFAKATEKLYAFSYDVLLLDLMLPDGDGLSLLRVIKENWTDMGVVIISAKNALNDKLKGLELGADDYLPKPFHLAELNARANAVYRRRKQDGKRTLSFNEIELNLDNHEVMVNDKSIELTRKEYELLHYFVVNQNRLLTKQAIAEHLWGDYMDTMDSFDFVYQHIKNLRKKIMEAGGKDYLKTVYGAGYKMKDE
ncbi:DNA-binding response regulator, OmpR family, contains REC and winged-helix (wHTH) domain [Ekhidna lutea]|uniref:DNA-binding response regulator, OmpR family, contains REC and winged-helix (WHTH) domain n=1 Tax=Ekhidna lutea TaxID=447679 RepID=A0A239LBI6_EKHLU|nr:response regulator transcription factor [Ekhidna lutea]SNT26914.1 DNA-binding response regulator, OmpR family, contains REC and winged-helix (wHTH) domain [Ekhidna lutea]